MSSEIIEVFASKGVWTLLSVLLIYYILKKQEERDKRQENREKNYQKIISDLTSKFELIHVDVKEIKNKLNT